jgi:signal transduction histidine kinase
LRVCFNSILFTFVFVLFRIAFQAQTGVSHVLKRIELSQDFTKNLQELQLLNKKTDLNREDYYHLQGLIISNYLNKNQLDSALKWSLKEFEKARQKGDIKGEARFSKWIGNVYFHLQEIEKALEYWEACIPLAQSINDYLTLEQCHHNIGSIIILKKGGFEAEPYFLKAIAFGKQVPGDNSVNLNKNYRLLASAYETSNRLAKADSVYRVTLSNYKTQKDTLGWLEAAMFYCKVLIKTNRIDQGLALNDSIVSITRKAKNYEMLGTALTLLGDNFRIAKRYDRLYDVMNEAILTEQKKNSEILRNEIAKSEAQFKLREINFEKEQSIRIERHQRNIYLLIFFSIFLTCLFLLIFYYRRKQAQIKQAQAFEKLKAVYEAQESERTRIAQDLHDNMGAYTTSILAQIDMMEQATFSDSPDRLTNLRYDAEHIMSTLRETIWILKTKQISVSGFFDLIKSYVNKQLRVNLNYNVQFKENIENDRILSASTSLHLFRIVQEATQNCIKHAEANAVSYQLNSTHELLQISMEDNGKGFDMEKKIRRSGLGNMIQRAKDIGFEIDITSAPGKGTRIELKYAFNKNTH